MEQGTTGAMGTEGGSCERRMALHATKRNERKADRPWPSDQESWHRSNNRDHDSCHRGDRAGMGTVGWWRPRFLMA